jgi:hypothetical protein
VVPASSQSGIDTGRVTAAMPESAQAFTLGDRTDGRLAVTLVLRSNLPEDTLELNVTGPSTAGQQVETSPFLYVYPGANPTLSFDRPAAGEWTARVRLASGAVADYELHWCADSDAARGPADNLACHRSYG